MPARLSHRWLLPALLALTGCSAGSTIERRSWWMSPLTPMIAGCPKVRPPAGVMIASKSSLVAMAWQASVVEAT